MKSLKFLFVLLLTSSFLSGCFETEMKVYDGPVVIEFAPRPGSANNYVHAVNVNTMSSVLVRTQLVGPHQKSEATVQFELGGTAVQGEHYTISHSGSVNIPAGSSFGDITITPNRDALAPGTSRTVTFAITGGTFPASERYKTYQVTLQRPAQ